MNEPQNAKAAQTSRARSSGDGDRETHSDLNLGSPTTSGDPALLGLRAKIDGLVVKLDNHHSRFEDRFERIEREMRRINGEVLHNENRFEITSTQIAAGIAEIWAAMRTQRDQLDMQIEHVALTLEEGLGKTRAAINDVHEDSVARDVVIDARCTQIDSDLATLKDNLVKTVGALTREAVANTMPAQSSPDTAAFTKAIGDLEVELATVKLAMQNMELQQSKSNE